ncbi:MAG: hypothetical protein COB02_07455 [Candidatus Cloacimonadota bacterium]|nr:MAG: hypothetical protein COB02_07455 [Candidatus Cloacimonadota bacterium]
MKYQDIQAALNKNDLLNIIPDSEIQKISDSFQVYSFSLGDIVLKAGDTAQGFFVIYSGKCRVLDEQNNEKAITLATLQKGDSFGEESLLLNKPVSKTVRASSTVILLKIPSNIFQNLIDTFQDFKSLIEQRIQLHDEVNFLRTLHVFSSLNPKESKLLLDSVERVQIKEGEFLFEENDPGDAAFIIRKGKVRVIKQSANNTVIAIVRPGILIGEMSLLYSRPRSAAVIASEDTECLKLSRDQFIEITKKVPNIQVLLNKQATHRLMQEETLLSQNDEHQEYTDRDSLINIQYKMIESNFSNDQFYCVETSKQILSSVCCIAMIAKSLDIDFSLDQLLDQQILSNKNESLSTISTKIEGLDILTRSLFIQKQKLNQALLPAIIEDQNGQLQILYKFDEEGVVICNPLSGLLHYSKVEFFNFWNQKLISLSSVPNLGKQQSFIKYSYLFLKPYFNLVFGIILLSIFIHSISLFGPFSISILLDQVLIHKDQYMFNSIILIGFIVMCFQCLSYFIRTNLVLHIIRNVSSSITLKFFHYILNLNMMERSKMQVGDLSSRINENERLLLLVSNNSLNVLSDSLSLFVYLFVLYKIHIGLTYSVFAFLLIFLVIFVLVTPYIRKQEIETFFIRNKQESFMVDLLSGIKTIKTDASEKLFFKDGLNYFYQTETERYKAYELNSFLTLMLSFFSKLCFVFILYLGASLVLKQELSLGLFLLYYTCLAFILIPLKDLSRIWDEFLEIRNSLKRISEVFNLKSDLNSNLTQIHKLDGAISLVDVDFQFDLDNYKKTLESISLEISQGEHISLVGRSGSGKSTLVQLIIKLYEVNSGAILLDHCDILSIDSDSIRKQILLIDSESWVFSGSIRENISIANKNIDFDKIIAASTLTLAHEFIQDLPNKYDTIIGDKGIGLSTGQLQKIALARAILTNPQVLILDEALSALDPESEAKVFRNLTNLMKGKTLIYIGNNPYNISSSDKIFVLNLGKLIEVGTHTQLTNKQEMYYHLFCRN